MFLLVLASMAIAILPAQQPVEPWKSPHFSADAKTLYAAASGVSAPDGTNITVLVESDSYSFDESGRLTHTGYLIFKVLTQKGAEGWDSLAVGWEPWHQARPVIRARVIAPDFSVHMLDAKTITETPAREGDYKTYSDGKRLRAPLPAIAPGVVVEEEYTERETEPLFAPGRVGEDTLGEERVPVEHSVAVFEFPASLPLRTQTLLMPDLKPVRSESDGKVTLTFEQGRLEGVEPLDPYLPSDVVHYPVVEYSTGASWQAIASAYADDVDNRAKSAAVQSIVSTLVAGKSSVSEKEAAIVDYLDREVRYTGIEFGESSIVPHDPADTLKEKYGDCKDKATLLVTMLRAAGIPAYVALLNAGSRMDVPPELPGMGMFDHAIVYVPGSPDLWIDATDRYARLGQLPSGDQGRLALIARATTTALVKTPESTSKDNVAAEIRELVLGDSGPAVVTERTLPNGVFESSYRSYYADKPDKDTRESLRSYVQSEYATGDLTKVERTDPADLSRQFELTLVSDKAKRGYTGLDNAQAAIRLDSLFHLLPDELKRKDDTDDKKKTEDQDKPQKPRTDDWELNAAFSADWQYRIVPPAGYLPKGLPQNARIAIGPALLTEEFSTGKDGVVLAHLAFDSVKRRYTVAEATELRNKVADLINGPAILVNFEPEGEAFLHDGKVKEALASYRALAAQHPDKAIYHLQVANVLLGAGMGEAARDEARLAVKLDPKSVLAEKSLAEILKHDVVGRSMRAGSDLSGAADAYRAAIKLDPDDDSIGGDLAILLEYDPVGRRYGSQAKLKDAIAEYQKLGPDKLDGLGLTNNLAFAMFYAGDFAGANKAAQTLNPQPNALIAACVAMLQDTKAGLAELNKRTASDAAFKEAANSAGQMLMNIRHYPQAADFLQAGASGDDAARALGLANMLRNAPHHEDVPFADTPAGVVKKAFLLTMDPDVTEAKLEAISSRSALAVMKNEDPDVLKENLRAGKAMNSMLARQGSSLDVTEDILLQELEPKGEGNDATGYRERMVIPGGTTITFFVVKEDGHYKILDSTQKPNSIAVEMLERIKNGDLAGAKALLDWLREDQHLEGGDDPLGGPVFPRFWTKGEAADAGKMTLAAASILVGTQPTADQGVSILEKALKVTTSDQQRTNILLALANGYSFQQNFAAMLDVSSQLLKQIPESKVAFVGNSQALMGLRRFDEAMALTDQRLKLLDGDTDALSMKVSIEAQRGNYKAAQSGVQKLIDQGKESAALLNTIAWDALFTDKVTDADVAAAIKATQLAKDNPNILHTLACLYAVTGKPNDARELLLRAMDDLNLDEPRDEYWYAFGLIAEQYGERDIAIADYRKLQKPKFLLALADSTYQLAQMRLKALGASAQ